MLFSLSILFLHCLQPPMGHLSHGNLHRKAIKNNRLGILSWLKPSSPLTSSSKPAQWAERPQPSSAHGPCPVPSHSRVGWEVLCSSPLMRGALPSTCTCKPRAPVKMSTWPLLSSLLWVTIKLETSSLLSCQTLLLGAIGQTLTSSRGAPHHTPGPSHMPFSSTAFP